MQVSVSAVVSIVANFWGGLRFPVSGEKVAMEWVPRLGHEYLDLSQFYSDSVASDYVIFYANNLAVGLTVLMLNIVFFTIWVMIRPPSDFARKQIGPKTRFNLIWSAVKFGLSKSKFGLLASSCLIMILLWVPMTYNPTPWTSSQKLIGGQYAFVNIIMPLTTAFVYCWYIYFVFCCMYQIKLDAQRVSQEDTAGDIFKP